MANLGGDRHSQLAPQQQVQQRLALQQHKDQASSSHRSDTLLSRIPKILPHERVFPIQIGCELFKLSGASISSDAPSYFSQYFLCQIRQAEKNGEDVSSAIRTLYIDRDPVTFKDIYLHLQGYHVQPRDATHFVRLFADAQFYSLPKLMSQLYGESVFTSIGHREFQIPRELFSDPGNSPNFFSLGFTIFFSTPEDVFPGLDREGLLRPPSIIPPSVPLRSADTFAELLRLLRGYPVAIRDETHRADLLRDCRYFNFRGLEQRLIPHSISFNQARRRDEIVIRLKDILKSGITVTPEPTAADPLAGWVTYARPFVDDRPYELVLEIGDETTRLQFGPGGAGASSSSIRAEFFRDSRTRIAKMFEVIATKLKLPPTTQPPGLLMAKGGGLSSQSPTPGNTPLSEDLVRVMLDPEASVTLDGRPWVAPASEEMNDERPYVTTTATVAPPSSGNMSAPSSAGGQDSPLSMHAPFSLSNSNNNNTIPPPSKKRRRVDSHGPSNGGMQAEEWIVRTGQWRLRIQEAKNGKAAVECVLMAVKVDAMSSEQSRNSQRGFLGG
ncbi:BTB/POZ domain-containing protein [Bombardia bombarda]|uniref:BTB/POZ domain-containing protein n=1 Tax=Bombardia bombarda TaxID=252184 RepID=A0AA40CDM8_9PEZI|nr:BTB/POZ domain-containing protein [Bombardia bombarda]